MKYTVETFRASGLEAKWTKRSDGSPAIVARNPNGRAHQRNQWWTITKGMFEAMQKDGIVEAFDNHTLLGDVFSVPA